MKKVVMILLVGIMMCLIACSGTSSKEKKEIKELKDKVDGIVIDLTKTVNGLDGVNQQQDKIVDVINNIKDVQLRATAYMEKINNQCEESADDLSTSLTVILKRIEKIEGSIDEKIDAKMKKIEKSQQVAIDEKIKAAEKTIMSECEKRVAALDKKVSDETVANTSAHKLITEEQKKMNIKIDKCSSEVAVLEHKVQANQESINSMATAIKKLQQKRWWSKAGREFNRAQIKSPDGSE